MKKGFKNSFIREIEECTSREKLEFLKESYFEDLVNCKKIIKTEPNNMFIGVEIENLKEYLRLIEKRLEEYK